MSNVSVEFLSASLVLLIFLSAFFSSAETGLMSINRVRLQHRAESGNTSSKRILRLLKRPDRLIGLILIGNNFVNILASAIATIIAVRIFGDAGVVIATSCLTLIILVVAEVTPKTFAALYPEKIAGPASLILTPLLKLIYPLVWLVNLIANGLLSLIGVNPDNRQHDRLTKDELRTLMAQSGHRIPARRHGMLLSILDLETIRVDEIMVPRGDIIGLNLMDDPSILWSQLLESQNTRLPVYKDNIENVTGILHLRTALSLHQSSSVEKKFWGNEFSQNLISLSKKPYFIPSGTPLHTQLFNFQTQRERLGLVVDEYGEIEGLLTIDDILEEIVGEFTTDQTQSAESSILPQSDGSFIIDGSIDLRDINRMLKWDLPTDGPRTLSGFLVEHLESIPESSICIKFRNYQIEVLSMKDNRVQSIKINRAKTNQGFQRSQTINNKF